MNHVALLTESVLCFVVPQDGKLMAGNADAQLSDSLYKDSDISIRQAPDEKVQLIYEKYSCRWLEPSNASCVSKRVSSCASPLFGMRVATMRM
jgi:hypothetical protein